MSGDSVTLLGQVAAFVIHFIILTRLLGLSNWLLLLRRRHHHHIIQPTVMTRHLIYALLSQVVVLS